MSPMYIALATLVFLIAVAWWVMTDKGAVNPADDEALLDFLDQTGYSIQHLATGWWAVTDSAQKMVGKPAQDVREAIMSAVDEQVS